MKILNKNNANDLRIYQVFAHFNLLEIFLSSLLNVIDVLTKTEDKFPILLKKKCDGFYYTLTPMIKSLRTNILVSKNKIINDKNIVVEEPNLVLYQNFKGIVQTTLKNIKEGETFFKAANIVKLFEEVVKIVNGKTTSLFFQDEGNFILIKKVKNQMSNFEELVTQIQDFHKVLKENKHKAERSGSLLPELRGQTNQIQYSKQMNNGPPLIQERTNRFNQQNRNNPINSPRNVSIAPISNNNLHFGLSKKPMPLSPIYQRVYRGIKNIGNSCYFNSLMQCLSKMSHFQKLLNNYSDHHDSGLIHELKLFFKELEKDEEDAMIPSYDLREMLQINRKTQEDPFELFHFIANNLMRFDEEAIKNLFQWEYFIENECRCGSIFVANETKKMIITPNFIDCNFYFSHILSLKSYMIYYNRQFP